jgi:hypothetical protein
MYQHLRFMVVGVALLSALLLGLRLCHIENDDGRTKTRQEPTALVGASGEIMTAPLGKGELPPERRAVRTPDVGNIVSPSRDLQELLWDSIVNVGGTPSDSALRTHPRYDALLAMVRGGGRREEVLAFLRRVVELAARGELSSQGSYSEFIGESDRELVATASACLLLEAGHDTDGQATGLLEQQWRKLAAVSAPPIEFYLLRSLSFLNAPRISRIRPEWVSGLRCFSEPGVVPDYVYEGLAKSTIRELADLLDRAMPTVDDHQSNAMSMTTARIRVNASGSAEERGALLSKYLRNASALLSEPGGERFVSWLLDEVAKGQFRQVAPILEGVASSIRSQDHPKTLKHVEETLSSLSSK